MASKTIRELVGKPEHNVGSTRIVRDGALSPEEQEMIADMELALAARGYIPTQEEEQKLAQIKAQMPGDVVTDHPSYAPPNPFLFVPYSEIKRRLAEGDFQSKEEQRLLRAALQLQRQH